MPLAADVFFEAEVLANKAPATFGKVGAFPQVYSLFSVGLGLAAIVGPGLSGLLYQTTNWQVTVSTLAALAALGSVPVSLYTGSRQRSGSDHGQMEPRMV